jgi:hypothetical protein
MAGRDICKSDAIKVQKIHVRMTTGRHTLHMNVSNVLLLNVTDKRTVMWLHPPVFSVGVLHPSTRSVPIPVGDTPEAYLDNASTLAVPSDD